MNNYVRNKLKGNVKANAYLRENSNWYKIINRTPSRVDEMIDEMKEKYGLRFKDKIENVNNILEILTLLKENDT